jgi:hypothetical protein
MDIFSKPGDDLPKIVELPEQTHSIERVQINDKRHYQVKTDAGIIVGAFPSVTSVLGATKDQKGLDRWRDRVGHDVAKQIGKDAVERGTVMHRLCELYCELPDNMEKNERLQAMLELSRHDEEVNQYDARAIVIGSQLFYNFYQTDFFERIKQGIFQEKFLWNQILHTRKDGTVEDLSYAGTVDNLSLMDDGLIKVVDFKTAKKAKQEKWILSYKKQCSAYAYAIKERYGIMPEGGEIWISNEIDRFPQCFSLNANDMKHFYREFLKDRRRFNEIMAQSNTDMDQLL